MAGSELDRNNIMLTLDEYVWHRDRSWMLEEAKKKIDEKCRDELGRLVSWKVQEVITGFLGIDEEKKEMPTVE